MGTKQRRVRSTARVSPRRAGAHRWASSGCGRREAEMGPGATTRVRWNFPCLSVIFSRATAGGDSPGSSDGELTGLPDLADKILVDKQAGDD